MRDLSRLDVVNMRQKPHVPFDRVKIYSRQLLPRMWAPLSVSSRLNAGAATPQLLSQKLPYRAPAKPSARPPVATRACAFWTVGAKPWRFHREIGRSGALRVRTHFLFWRTKTRNISFQRARGRGHGRQREPQNLGSHDSRSPDLPV